MEIFDTHAHYDDDWFDDDREELIKSFQASGVKKVCNIGATFRGCQDTVSLVNKYDFFYGALGIHPTEIDDLEKSPICDGKNHCYEVIKQWANEIERIVAIGEIGLDYHLDNCDEAEKEKQATWFKKQLQLAKELGLPVVIHSRDAAEDTMRIMKQLHAEEIGGVIHCYSYSPEMAKQYVDMGFYIGVGGVVTFKNGKKLKETVEAIPLTSIVLETDAPYMAPEPHRGERNSSLYIPKMAEEIARIKNVDVEEVYRVTYENAHKLYRIPKA